MKISVIGLGHLGLPLAALLAAAGHDVVGVDKDAALIARLRNGELASHEPGFKDVFAAAASRLCFTKTAMEGLAASDVSLILVPSPPDASGGYDPAHVVEAAASIGVSLRGHERPHVTVVMSTLMPGTTAREVARVLEQSSARRIGPALGLCYSPVFGAIGALLQNYRNPDFLLIGESSAGAGDIAETLLCSFMQGKPAVLRRSLLNAELAKIALNNYLIMKISFANMVGGLCREIPHADSGEVLSVLGHDKRIGEKFLRAAMPYGGPCFAHDAGALQAFGQQFATDMPLVSAAEAVNRAHLARLIGDMKAATPAGGRISILGLAFRQGTDVTACSPAVYIARQLAAAGFYVAAWDPLTRPEFGPEVTLAETLAECIADADTVLIANDDPVFAELPKLERTITVFDYWRRVRGGGNLQFRRLD